MERFWLFGTYRWKTNPKNYTELQVLLQGSLMIPKVYFNWTRIWIFNKGLYICLKRRKNSVFANLHILSSNHSPKGKVKGCLHSIRPDWYLYPHISKYSKPFWTSNLYKNRSISPHEKFSMQLSESPYNRTRMQR